MIEYTMYEAYICDPEKNERCGLSTGKCSAKRNGCKSTTYPQFAKLDENGNPIIDQDAVAYAKEFGLRIIKRNP